MLPGTALNRCGHLEISEDHEGTMKWGTEEEGGPKGGSWSPDQGRSRGPGSLPGYAIAQL